MKILKFEDIREDVGEWLMDIAKYVATAVIIASLFERISSVWLLMMAGFLTVGLALFFGLLLMVNGKQNN